MIRINKHYLKGNQPSNQALGDFDQQAYLFIILEKIKKNLPYRFNSNDLKKLRDFETKLKFKQNDFPEFKEELIKFLLKFPSTL